MDDLKKRYLLAEQTIGPDDLVELVDWLKRNPWLTQGSLVREFERLWADWLGARHAVYVNSGSSANLLAYYVLSLSRRLRNRKVVVPAVSWPTTVAPSIQLGFEPLMCDADSETLGLCPDHLEQLLIEHDPATVVLVHVLGVPCQMDRILQLRQRHGFLLIEDACAATGSRLNGNMVGTFGELSTFSFFYGHHMSTVEGGMVCTDDAELYHLLLLTRAHGWAKDVPPDVEANLAAERKPLQFNRPFTFYVPGFNVRGSDLTARIGLSQLRGLDRVVKQRVENHRAYQARFLNASGFSCQRNDNAVISSIAFAALAPSSEARDIVAASLRSNGVETRPLGGGNMSRQPFWRDIFAPQALPVADRVHDTAFQLPNHAHLGLQDVNRICDVVFAALA